MNDDALEYDVVIIGAGPAGLAAAIRLKQLSSELSVCVLEKASEIGAHIISGAVFDTRPLDELIPDWRERGAPVKTAVTHDQFYLLTTHKSYRLPTPPSMHNTGHYIISLGQLCRWLGEQAEALGVELFPGFAAVECLYDEHQRVCGVRTGEMGIDKSGQHLPHYQPGVEIYGKSTLLAEGARGSLSQTIIQRYKLNENCAPQTYGIGLKEVWRVNNTNYQPGLVLHTVGWPLDTHTYGGSFLYHAGDNLINLGLVIGLDYPNPYLNPYEELQRLKNHPLIREHIVNGERISYGARALTEGGFQSIPRCAFPGGAIIGCSAGFMNVAKIKGSHNAMKSGIIAAEAIVHQELSALDSLIEHSWIGEELYRARNIRPGFRWGLWAGLAHAAVDTYLFRGKAPWTLSHHYDHQQLKPARYCEPIQYPKHDNQYTFDKLTSLSFSNVGHEENQPSHLHLHEPQRAISCNLRIYASPESRYCPAGVYEIVHSDKQKPETARLQINAQNCLHCKTCDIKDPQQNIRWVPPQGGGGPNYSNM